MKKCRLFSAFTAILALEAAFLLSNACQEPEYNFYSSIEGTVLDSSTSAPIENASVVLSPSNKTVLTDSEGEFFFEEIDPVQYTILIQKEGYYTERKIVTAITDETVRVHITIKKI